MNKRVLLVEDDSLIAELLEMVLMLEGVDVTIASNGAEALARLEADRFDMIVLDLMMPVLDGLGLLDRLGAIGQAHQPILVFSASTSREIADRALKAGAAAVARKPLDRDEFLAIVRRLLGE